MPMTQCFFCRRKVGKRKRGKLAYEDIYARDPSWGYIVCIDCFEALETSIRKVRLRQIDESNKKLETIARARYEEKLWEGSESNPKNQER